MTSTFCSQYDVQSLRNQLANDSFKTHKLNINENRNETSLKSNFISRKNSKNQEKKESRGSGSILNANHSYNICEIVSQQEKNDNLNFLVIKKDSFKSYDSDVSPGAFKRNNFLEIVKSAKKDLNIRSQDKSDCSSINQAAKPDKVEKQECSSSHTKHSSMVAINRNSNLNSLNNSKVHHSNNNAEKSLYSPEKKKQKKQVKELMKHIKDLTKKDIQYPTIQIEQGQDQDHDQDYQEGSIDDNKNLNEEQNNSSKIKKFNDTSSYSSLDSSKLRKKIVDRTPEEKPYVKDLTPSFKKEIYNPEESNINALNSTLAIDKDKGKIRKINEGNYYNQSNNSILIVNQISETYNKNSFKNNGKSYFNASKEIEISKSNNNNNKNPNNSKTQKTILVRGKTSSQRGCEDVSCACMIF